jgi:hypothetical protein
VSKQRAQYALMMEGKHSQLTKERVRLLLNELGFAWSARDKIWDNNLRALAAYYKKENKGSILVPVAYETEDGLALGEWVSNQRTRLKNVMNMTVASLIAVVLVVSGSVDTQALSAIRYSTPGPMSYEVSDMFDISERIPDNTTSFRPRANLQYFVGLLCFNVVSISRERIPSSIFLILAFVKSHLSTY